jgi:peptidoglycan/xylan/chitin deacetylase (PgdA/CDA1 family)
MEPVLHVVMYHYVRDLPRTAYPKLKAMLLDDFCSQVDELSESFEMATLESSLAFIDGAYEPSRDLCLLTFDDGVKEHFQDVTPLLAERGIEGQFFLITGALENKRVAPVHMNHFLMAGPGFDRYREEFLRELGQHGISIEATCAPEAVVRKTYPWDTPEVASFKYLFNFILPASVRDEIVRALFEKLIGPENAFSEALYVSWDEARQMQAAGMVIGGHTQEHRPLATLSNEELEADLSACKSLLTARLRPQNLWPFCYPYGKTTSFDHRAQNKLRNLGFACAFTTEAGPNAAGAARFEIRRVDCKNAETNSGAERIATAVQ